MKTVFFTIGRQYGSGGHEIGEKLAKKLNIPFYDNELISLAAQKSGVSKDVFEKVDEKPTNSFLYSLAMGTAAYTNNMSGFVDLSINDRLFVAQSEVIEEIASNGSCVIVGRCANYILRDFDNCIDIFCYGDIKDRVKRIQSLHNLLPQKAIEFVNRKDKKTASYYNCYSDKKWGDCEGYDLMINTSALHIDKAVELIIDYAEIKNRE